MGQLIQALGNGYAYANPGQGSGGSGKGQSGGLDLGQLFGKAQSQQQSPVGLNTDPSKMGAKTGMNSLVSNYLMNPTLQNAASTA